MRPSEALPNPISTASDGAPITIDTMAITKIIEKKMKLAEINLIRQKLIAAMEKRCNVLSKCQKLQNTDDSHNNLINATIKNVALLYRCYIIMTYYTENQTFSDRLFEGFVKKIGALVQDQTPHESTDFTFNMYIIIHHSIYSPKIHSEQINYINDFFSKKQPVDSALFHVKIANRLGIMVNPALVARIQDHASHPKRRKHRALAETANEPDSVSFLAKLTLHYVHARKTQQDVAMELSSTENKAYKSLKNQW